MQTVSFGNAFSLRYRNVPASEGVNHRLSEAEQAGKQERVGDRFTRLVQDITGQETRRIRTPQGDYLLMNGPNGKTLSLYKELERGLGKGASPEEQTENTRIILDTLRQHGSFPMRPKVFTLQYGPEQVADYSKISQSFAKMGFSVKKQSACLDAIEGGGLLRRPASQ